MGNKKWSGKLAPIAHRRDEAQLLNLNDAPIATRLRSRYKDDEASQIEPNEVAGSHNQTGKRSHHLTHERNQPSRNAKINLSPSPDKISRSRQLSEGPNSGNETKSRSKNECEKKQLASERFAQARSETNDAPSHSQVRQEKVRRPSKESAKQNMDGRTRPLRDPDDQPVVEACISYIRSEETKRQRVGWSCEFCEKDLGVSPFEEDAKPPHGPSLGDFLYQRGEEQRENSLLPEVTVLPCGHVFHNICLQQLYSEEQIGDGSCIFCLSML